MVAKDLQIKIVCGWFEMFCWEHAETCCVCRDFLLALNLWMFLVDCIVYNCNFLDVWMCNKVSVIGYPIEHIALMTPQNFGCRGRG